MSNVERWQKFKPLPGDIDLRLAHLQPLLKQNQVQLAYLFGSLARDESGHDVDLAILSKQEIELDLYLTLTEALGTERIDLVDLKTASPAVRFEIIRTGRLIFADNEHSQLDFELETLRVYKDTAWMRRRQEMTLRERLLEWSLNELSSSSG